MLNGPDAAQRARALRWESAVNAFAIHLRKAASSVHHELSSTGSDAPKIRTADRVAHLCRFRVDLERTETRELSGRSRSVARFRRYR